jgi:hypothetical protein
MAFNDHVTEYNITHNAFIPVLNANSPVAFFDNAIIKYYLPDRIHILAADLDGTAAACHGTIGYCNIFAAAKLFVFPAVL